jgi:PAS domain S-box-containing protein
MDVSFADGDSRILGQLLTASSAFSAFADGRRMADYLVMAVAGVPGLGGSAVCLPDGRRPRFGDDELPECDACGAFRMEPGCAAVPHCPIESRKDVRAFPLRTQDALLGFFVCRVVAAGRFEPYEPFLHNLASSLAVHVDRCRRKDQLESANAELMGLRDHLQDLVAKRTEELRDANERLRHLNAVLRSIRDVNQLIVREDDPGLLVQAACETLVRTRGYFDAWIALADDSGKLALGGVAGVDEDHVRAVRRLDRLDGLPCIQPAMARADVSVVSDRPATCSGCPLYDGATVGRTPMVVRLENRGRVLGVLVAKTEPRYSGDDEERSLLREVAADIALALNGIAQERTRRRAEVALADEKERLAVTLRSIGDGVITTDREGRVVLLNRVAENLTGWRHDEAAGQPLREVFRIINQVTREPCEDPVSKVLASGRVVGLANHTVLVARDGSERVLADSGAPIRDRDNRIVGVVLVFRDVTREHQREAELQKVQKLESVGLLAGGIAHDFNNLLTAVLGNISLARLDAPPGTRQTAWLEDAEKAVGRARDLTQQLLTFSKGGAPIRKAARIGEMIIDSAGFSLRGSNVRCIFAIPDDLWPVEADLGQLSQVMSNLVINADEAMPGGGTIRVAARNVPPGEPRPEPLADGRMVEISVEDQGIGIDEEHLHRVFDPFFTTKKRGSGLGLTTCYSIVRNHQGLITAESRRGHGATFRVYLPASAAQPAPRAAEDAVVPGRGRILVMDDEELVRGVSSQMLAYLGYEVETAADGAEAIEKYAAARAVKRPFDAVILDITVPGGMGGGQAIERLRAIDPDVRAVVSSGYSNDPIMADFRGRGFRGIATKPYDLRGLSRALRDVLS